MNSKPASSAVRATVARSAPSRAGPAGVVKSGICRPIFTRHLHRRGFHTPGPTVARDGPVHRFRYRRWHRPPPARDRPGPGWLPHPVTQNGVMSAPVLKAETLVTTDGVPIDAIHLPGGRELAI